MSHNPLSRAKMRPTADGAGARAPVPYLDLPLTYLPSAMLADFHSPSIVVHFRPDSDVSLSSTNQCNNDCFQPEHSVFANAEIIVGRLTRVRGILKVCAAVPVFTEI